MYISFLANSLFRCVHNLLEQSDKSADENNTIKINDLLFLIRLGICKMVKFNKNQSFKDVFLFFYYIRRP